MFRAPVNILGVMTILIGYLPAPEGEAALRAGFAEAKLRSSTAVAINPQRRGASGTPPEIGEDEIKRIVDLGNESDIEVEVLQPDHENDRPRTRNVIAAAAAPPRGCRRGAGRGGLGAPLGGASGVPGNGAEPAPTPRRAVRLMTHFRRHWDA